MEKFIPREKLGKKARRALDRQRRAAWGIRPVTRRVQSKKLYSRKDKSRARYDDGMGFLAVWNLPRNVTARSLTNPAPAVRMMLSHSLHRRHGHEHIQAGRPQLV